MEMPSGRRSSAPLPNASASGSAPSRAAAVVIMIGRKRIRQAWKIASRLDAPSLRSALSAKSIIRMAFFLTMPISRMTPITAMRENSVLSSHQRQHRADAGRGQGGQDGDRMDEALVEHAEHDVDREQGGADQHRLAVQRLLEHLRGAGEAADDVGRHMQVARPPC